MKRSLTSFFAMMTLATAEAGGAQAFELKSPDVAEGQKIDMKHVYDSFGCTGANVSPELKLERPAGGHEELRRAHARSRRAHRRRRLLALARGRHSRRTRAG